MTTPTGALRLGGVTAPMILDGPMNRVAFQAYVEQMLVPILCRSGTIIMDTPPTHKGSEVPRAVDAAGTALGCLPPYSPDLNPIKNAFPRLKAILRKAAGRAVNGLWDATRDALPRLIPQDCASYFTAAGYEPE